MTRPTLETSAEPIHETLLDTDPAVAMSIDLGRQLNPGEVVNVSYEGLRNTLDALSTPVDNSELLVNFVSPNDKSLHGASGQYSLDDMQIDVKIHVDDLDQTQNTLEHELQHYVDDLDGHYDRETGLRRRLYDAGNVARRHISRLMGFSLGNTVATLFVGYQARFAEDPPLLSWQEYEAMFPYVEMANAATLVALIGGIAIEQAYWREPSEVRARQAEEEVILPPTVTIS